LLNIYYKLPALASKQEGNQARQAIKSLALPTLTTCAHKLQSSPRYYGYATIIIEMRPGKRQTAAVFRGNGGGNGSNSNGNISDGSENASASCEIPKQCD